MTIESISLKKRVPKLRMSLGETEMTLIFFKTTIPFYSELGMKLHINNVIESISLKQRIPMLRMGFGETEMTLICVKTTIHLLQCGSKLAEPDSVDSAFLLVIFFYLGKGV